MASSKDFKRAIREGRLNDAFVMAIGNAPQLHITTWIASTDDNKTQPHGGNCLRTHVNLVEGEIINEIGEKLIGDNLYGTLQQFHLQQVTQGHQTISQNLQSLQQMFRLLAILQKQQKGETYTPINTWKIAETSLPSTSVSNPTSENNSTQTINSAPASELVDVSTIDNDYIDEEDDVVNDLLSLDDLDLEVESPRQEQIPPQEQKTITSAKDGEDWGDWLEEDNSATNANLIELDDVDIEQSKDWHSEDWEDESEFTSNPSRRE